MNLRQEKFCDEYIIDRNATQAAIRAGYSKKTANRIGPKLLSNIGIKNRIEELREEYHNKQIATAAEVEAMLSRTMRGELEEEVVVVEGDGDGFSKARVVHKQVGAKDRIKAAELMGKRHGIFSADTNIEIKPIIITGEDDIHE